MIGVGVVRHAHLVDEGPQNLAAAAAEVRNDEAGEGESARQLRDSRLAEWG